MQHSKMLAALKACQKKELDSLRRFVASPYFNRQPELERALNFLLPHWPAFEGTARDKKAIYKAAFPNADFDEKQFRYLSSGLGQLVEQFWAVEKWRQTTWEKDLTLLKSAFERGAEKSYRKTNRRLEASLQEAQPTADSRFFLTQVQWFETAQQQFFRSRERRFDESIQRQSDSLDRYYFLEKLKFACAMLDRQGVVAGEYRPRVSAAWVQHLLEQDCFGEPLIRLYYDLWRALKTEDDPSIFFAVRDRLSGDISGIPMGELLIVYHACINYCARKIRHGEDAYVTIALDLYIAALECGALLSDGDLSPWAFTNIVKLSMRLQRYAWGENFIRQYAPLLPATFRDNAMHFNLAELFYYTGRSDDAMGHLMQVAFSDLNYYLGARVLLAKIYYENGDEEPLISLLAAFTIFLKRNREISADLKQTYLNFCDLLLRLVSRSPRKTANLGDKIRETPLLAERKWLLEHLEEG